MLMHTSEKLQWAQDEHGRFNGSTGRSLHQLAAPPPWARTTSLSEVGFPALRSACILLAPCPPPPSVPICPPPHPPTAGSRLAALLALPLLAPLPMHLHLLAQACGCVLVMRGAPLLCTTRLMEHPLMGQRISEFNTLLGALSQPRKPPGPRSHCGAPGLNAILEGGGHRLGVAVGRH